MHRLILTFAIRACIYGIRVFLCCSFYGIMKVFLCTVFSLAYFTGWFNNIQKENVMEKNCANICQTLNRAWLSGRQYVAVFVCRLSNMSKCRNKFDKFSYIYFFYVLSSFIRQCHATDEKRNKLTEAREFLITSTVDSRSLSQSPRN